MLGLLHSEQGARIIALLLGLAVSLLYYPFSLCPPLLFTKEQVFTVP